MKTITVPIPPGVDFPEAYLAGMWIGMEKERRFLMAVFPNAVWEEVELVAEHPNACPSPLPREYVERIDLLVKEAQADDCPVPLVVDA